MKLFTVKKTDSRQYHGLSTLAPNLFPHLIVYKFLFFLELQSRRAAPAPARAAPAPAPAARSPPPPAPMQSSQPAGGGMLAGLGATMAQGTSLINNLNC